MKGAQTLIFHVSGDLDPALAAFVAEARARYRTAGMLDNPMLDDQPAGGAEADAAGRRDGPFDVVFSPTELGTSGGDQAVAPLIAARVGADPTACVFVSDHATEVTGARRAGMVAVRAEQAADIVPGLRDVLGMVERHYVAAGGVVLHHQRVLLLRRESRNEWRLPKGHVEPGETDEEAALREVAEETGYDDLIIDADLGRRHLDFDTFAGRGPGQHVARDEHYFGMTLASARTRARGRAELKFRPRWVPVAEAAELLTYEFERAWLALAGPSDGTD